MSSGLLNCMHGGRKCFVHSTFNNSKFLAFSNCKTNKEKNCLKNPLQNYVNIFRSLKKLHSVTAKNLLGSV